MNYLDIVKRAWGTTWRYKILWLFGLFAGAGGAGGGNSSSNWNSGSGNSGSGNAASQQFLDQLQNYLPLIIAVGAFLVLIGIVFFVLTYAAQGGLAFLVNEAEEKRAVKAADGWRVGFAHWGRVFLLNFLIGLPMIVILVLFLVIFGASIFGIVAATAGGDTSSLTQASGLAGGIGGFCCGLVFLFVTVFAYSIVFGTVNQLAIRYAVLEERTAIESLKQGWSDVWAKRGAIGMFFVMWVTSMVYSVVLTVMLMIFIVPIIVMAIAGNFIGVAAVSMVAGLVAMLPAAVYGAFSGSAWTIFFRRMTGREQGPAAVLTPAYGGGFPPAPPAPPGTGFPEPPAAEYTPPVEPAPPAVDPWQAANDVPPVVPPATSVAGPDAPQESLMPPPPPEGA
ncbi:MAG: hypothetical protein Q7W16_00125 [Coriobacteriia bacterium]|nr:hypothetical protein [Coriobacteriia bacterium]